MTVATWVSTVQSVVNAIRAAGATNYLLLPGSSYASAQTFPTEAGPGLVTVTDPLGGTEKLIFDGKRSRLPEASSRLTRNLVHKYLDSDNSGTHAECVTVKILISF